MRAISLSEREFVWLRKSNSDETWSAIRIVSQPTDLTQTSRRFNNQFEAICIVQFTDIDEPIEDDGVLYKPYSSDNHDRIIDFVNQNKHVDKLYVHCAAGICRSAGVVAGLAKQYDWITAQHGLNGTSKVMPYHNVISHYK